MIRVGVGYDVHRFEPGRKLILGGVEIPHEQGLAGHSDADALTHAIIDALLGAAALGDIGAHFPDTDAAYRDADSRKLLARVVALLREKGMKPNNVDSVVVAQRPKLAPHIPEMREVVSSILGDLARSGGNQGDDERENGLRGTRGGRRGACGLHDKRGFSLTPILRA